MTNIKRAAELLDGTILRAANGVLAQRGARQAHRGERLRVGAADLPRRLEDAVGGGISQIATTLFNAAFFAGLKLVAHQAHQFYISRYPMGREATVSWGGPELIFRNDWPAAMLMKLSATTPAITVRFYSRKLGRRVETTTGEPYSYVAPRTITVANSGAPPGTTNTSSPRASRGSRVQYTRKVFKGPELDQGRAIHGALRRAERDRRGRAAEAEGRRRSPKPPRGAEAAPEPAEAPAGTIRRASTRASGGARAGCRRRRGRPAASYG